MFQKTKGFFLLWEKLPKLKLNQSFLKVGNQIVAELWYCQKYPQKEKELEEILIESAKKAGATPLKSVIYKFSPQGITGVILLAESHIAIHTWPELNYIAVDIFTCGQKTDPKKALEYIAKRFQPKKINKVFIERGKNDTYPKKAL